MNYNVDKSGIGDGVFTYDTESGCKYLGSITETAENSGLWTLSFFKLSGNPDKLEVFRIMKTLSDSVMEYAINKNIKNILITIAGDTTEEIEQKTIVFQRWIKDDWDYTIIPNMEIKISGYRNSRFNIPTNSLMLKRKERVVEKQISTNGNLQIKFCYNCGVENKGFQFCPNCGTNLKQN